MARMSIEDRRAMVQREAGRTPVSEMARRAGVRASTIRRTAASLGVDTRVNWQWTPERDAQLRELYPVMSATQVSRRIGCSATAVYDRAKALGVRKTPGPNAALPPPAEEPIDQFLRRTA